jgi:hypothetical protein
MKYVSAKYEAQLDALAESLMRGRQQHLGQLSLLDQAPAEPEGAKILKFPMAQVVELPIPSNIQLGAE